MHRLPRVAPKHSLQFQDWTIPPGVGYPNSGVRFRNVKLKIPGPRCNVCVSAAQ